MKKKDIENESTNMKNRKQKKPVFEKMPLTYGPFHQHIKSVDKAVIEMKNPEHFGWKFDVTRYIAMVTDSPIAPDTVVSFASCDCKSNTFLLALGKIP